jgi:cell division septum initiation protein DivIVA
MAQKNADDMRTNAANEAERVVRDAKEQMNRELADARRELEDLRNTRLRFQTELRSLLNSYLAMSEGDTLGGGTGEFTEE